MQSSQRKRFNTSQDWNNFLSAGKEINGQEIFGFRTNCYKEIEQLRGNPLIVYATKFLENVLPGTPNNIDLSDVDGFTDLVNNVPDTEEIDVLIHSPGGRPDATERIVSVLRNKFPKS